MYQLGIIINWIKKNNNLCIAMHTEIEVWLIIFNCKTPFNSTQTINDRDN